MRRKLYRVEEVAEVLNVGRTKVFDLIRSGQLASVKVGGSRRVTEQAIDDYQAGRMGTVPAAELVSSSAAFG